MTCLFCKIASGEIPSEIVYKDDLVVAFRDINPQAPTHILIIPREHIASLLELEPAHADAAAAILLAAQELAKKEGLTERGYRLVANYGPDAGQSVDHVHFHFLGGRHLHWPPG